jgi:hypothetical protein
MPTLYWDNDAELLARKLPGSVVPNWAVTRDPDTFPVIPVHGSLSGIMVFDAEQNRFEAVLEGDAITAHLSATDPNDPTDRYFVVVWYGQNVRKVLPDIEVSIRRT